MALPPLSGRLFRTALCALVLAAAPAVSWAEPALQLSAEYTADVLANLRGGAARGGRYLDKLEIAAGLIFESADGDEGGVSIAAHHLNGGALSGDLVGDAQGVSNIEAPAGPALVEAWASRTFAGGRAGLKAGVIDLNSEFDVQDVGALFLNSSHGVGAELAQTGSNGPSIFPLTGLGLTLFVRPAEAWTIRAGIFEGDPLRRGLGVRLSRDEGALAIAEVEHTFGGAIARLGAWTYTAQLPALPTHAASGEATSRGAYGLVEWTVLQWDQGDAVRAWTRFGIAEPSINPIAWYAGGGLVRTGLWREDDRLGVAVAHAAFGAPARRVAGLTRAETIVELTYDRALDTRVRIQPTLQLVRNPGGDQTVRNAVVGGVRLTLRWEGP